MSTKVVLPDFNFPGSGPHPAIRALWVSGGLVFVATMILGVALWHRHGVDLAAQSAAAHAVATASDQVQPTAIAPAAHPLAASPAAAAVPAQAPEAVVAPVVATASAPARHHGGGRHHHMHASKVSRTRAVAARDGRSSRNSSPKKDDAIDRLLKQFK